MISIDEIPIEAVGLQLCRALPDDQIEYCEPVFFENKRNAVWSTLNKAAVSGHVGPIGELGPLWADILNDDGDWIETVALSRGARNALKRRWMRCRVLR